MEENKKITIGEAVRLVRVKRGLTMSQLADQIPGYDGGNLSRFERNLQNIAEDKLSLIAEVLRISVAALYTVAECGNADAADNFNQPQYAFDNSIPAITPIRKVPVISMVRAGQWTEICCDYNADEWKETSAKVGKCAFALKVVGDSMTNPYGSPSIPEGAFVIVDPDVQAISGSIVVARLIDSNEATVKKLVFDGPNKYLVPLNPNYKPIPINGNCEIVGVVKQMEVVF